MLISTTSEGLLTLSVATPGPTIQNAMLTSVFTQQGTFFQRPDFGSRHHEIDKITDDTLELLKAHLLNALQWLIDTGKALSNTVEVIQESLHRVRIKIETVQADGQEISFSVFKTVA